MKTEFGLSSPSDSRSSASCLAPADISTNTPSGASTRARPRVPGSERVPEPANGLSRQASRTSTATLGAALPDAVDDAVDREGGVADEVELVGFRRRHVGGQEIVRAADLEAVAGVEEQRPVARPDIGIEGDQRPAHGALVDVLCEADDEAEALELAADRAGIVHRLLQGRNVGVGIVADDEREIARLGDFEGAATSRNERARDKRRMVLSPTAATSHPRPATRNGSPAANIGERLTWRSDRGHRGFQGWPAVLPILIGTKTACVQIGDGNGCERAVNLA